MTKQEKVDYIVSKVTDPQYGNLIGAAVLMILIPLFQDSSDDPDHPLIDNIISTFQQLGGQ